MEESSVPVAMYKTIVVGYEGSEYSKAALTEAAIRVKKTGGKLILVHAVYFDDEEFGIAPVQLEKRLEVGQKICYQTKEKFASAYGIEIESLVCEGEPPEVLVDIAQGKGADLIALGTHGRKGLKRLLLGSVTSGVIHKSQCDVLVIKKRCTDCTGSFKSILVAYDGSASSRKCLARSISLARSEGAELTALYVIPRYEEMVEFFMTESIRKSLNEEGRKVLSTANEIASKEGFPLATMVQEGQSAAKVIEMAGKLKSDLIAMGSHGWTGVNKAIIGSTAERVIINAACPVLIVR